MVVEVKTEVTIQVAKKTGSKRGKVLIPVMDRQELVRNAVAFLSDPSVCSHVSTHYVTEHSTVPVVLNVPANSVPGGKRSDFSRN